MLDADVRGRRVALVADALVNPGEGDRDGLATLARAGWGAMQLPAAWYPDELTGPLLEQAAEQAQEFVRHGYALVLLTVAGEPDGGAHRARLLAALAAAGVGPPPEHAVGGSAELAAFLVSAG